MLHILRFRVLLAALLCAGVFALAAPQAAADLRDNGDGTLTDAATGLTWVADADFAAAVGFPLWASRAEAVELVRAMNAGEVESFGRHDWRLPTARERASLESGDGGGGGLRRIAAASRTASGPVELRPVAGSALVAGIADAAVVATHSVLLGREVRVIGDVVANEAGAAESLAVGWEVALDREARVEGDVAGDRVRLDRGAVVTGDVASNSLAAGGATFGSTTSPLALPVFAMLPPFAVSNPRPDAADVFVGVGDVVELPAGSYRQVTVDRAGTLLLTGGVYEISGLELGREARLLFRTATDLRVRGRFATDRDAEVGPEEGSGLSGADLLLYVGGVDGADGVFGSSPPAVAIQRNSLIRANLYVADGSVHLHRQAMVEGSIIARHVFADRECVVALASAWGNQPPVAEPQTVSTGGAASIVIVLSGSDPEGGDLSFAITDPPDFGTLSAPAPIVPPVEIDPDTGLPVEAPVTRANVTYVPAGPGDVEDSFTFEVADPFGSFGTAMVTINPPATDEPPPPPPETVVVADLAGTVRRDVPAIVTLGGSAPDGVDLGFALVAGTGPDHGTLGPLAPGSESPVRTAAATYTPAPGFVGSDDFGFEACGTVAGALVCDQGVFSIEVVEPPVEVGELAADVEVAAFEEVPVEIDLLTGATENEVAEGSTAGELRRITGRAVGQVTVVVAGNVADADGDGFGDEHNALPGPVPGLVSAGVGGSGGPGSNGTRRIQVELPIGFLGTTVDDLASATVRFTTRRGTVDALDTFFWVAGDGNGTLEEEDFERPAEVLPGVTMPVPPTQAVGEDGTFAFGVLPQIKAAAAAGHDWFSLQGRVDESLVGPGRGLQVYSTADGNVADGLVPVFTFSTPPPSVSVLVTVTALPQFGTLLGPNGQPITSVPTTISGSRVTYVPDFGFVGTDSFTYEVSDFSVTDVGVVTLVVQAGSCATNVSHCEDGR